MAMLLSVTEFMSSIGQKQVVSKNRDLSVALEGEK